VVAFTRILCVLNSFRVCLVEEPKWVKCHSSIPSKLGSFLRLAWSKKLEWNAFPVLHISKVLNNDAHASRAEYIIHISKVHMVQSTPNSGSGGTTKHRYNSVAGHAELAGRTYFSLSLSLSLSLTQWDNMRAFIHIRMFVCACVCVWPQRTQRRSMEL
jgi:hypothetical protein